MVIFQNDYEILGSLISAAFMTYVNARIMKIFFGEKKKEKNDRWVMILLQFCLCSFAFYWFDNHLFRFPFLVLSTYLLTMIYQIDTFHKIIFSFFTPITIWGFDLFFTYMLGGTAMIFSEPKLSFLFYQMVSRITVLLIATAIINIQKAIRRNRIPAFSWISQIVFPLGLLLITFFLFQNKEMSIYLKFAMTAILFMELIMVFYYNDYLVENLQEKREKLYLAQFEKGLNNHYQDIKLIVTANKSLHHDLKNHMISIKYMLDSNEIEEAKAYIEKMESLGKVDYERFDTGSIAVDAMLQIKSLQAKDEGVILETNVQPLGKANISPISHTVILGNLLDNAIEAASKVQLENKRIVSLNMKYEQGALFIRITNPYNYTLKKSGARFLTTKEKPEGHGLGISNVENVVKAHNGYMNINSEDGVFEVTIMMEDENLSGVDS